MPSKHLLDPELELLVSQLPPFDFRPGALAQTRAMMEALATASGLPSTDRVDIDSRVIPGPSGCPDVRVLVTRPKVRTGPGPGILHIHGGGYVMGSPEMGLATDIAYAEMLGATVVSVDYRLAPETPHPGPVEDCYAALAWLHAEAAALGIDRKRIAVTGESAGGGLAAAVTLLARDRGLIKVAFQHLVFPMLDDRTTVNPDPSPYFGEFIWTPEHNLFGWSSLLGGTPGGADVSCYAAPARAEDLAGLPPTYLACGALDLFLEENLDFARRLMRAGVPTELHIYPGAPHAFMLVPTARVAQIFARDSMAALEHAVGA